MTPATKPKQMIRGEARYKGRIYAVLFDGRTKFGHKMKLAFRDLTKEFWVAEHDAEYTDIFNPFVETTDYVRRDTQRGEEAPQPTGRSEVPALCASCGQPLPF